jgi:hypothetical protein
MAPANHTRQMRAAIKRYKHIAREQRRVKSPFNPGSVSYGGISLPLLKPAIRQSTLATYATCRRMFWWEHRHNVKPRGYTSATEIGNIVHLGLNALWAGWPMQTAANLMQTHVEQAKKDLLKWFQDNGTESGWQTWDRTLTMDAITARVMVEQHWERFKVPDGAIPLAIEQEFRVHVENLGVPLEGRLDICLKVELGGVPGIIVVDHKTTSNMAAYLTLAGWDGQGEFYRLLAAPYFAEQNLPIYGFILNMLQKPTIKPSLGTTPEQWEQQVRAWYRAEDDTVGNGEVFKSGPRKDQPKPRWEYSENATRFAVAPPFQQKGRMFDANAPLVGTELAGELVAVDFASNRQHRIEDHPRTGRWNRACCDRYGKPCKYAVLCENEDPLRVEAALRRGFTLPEGTQ